MRRVSISRLWLLPLAAALLPTACDRGRRSAAPSGRIVALTDALLDAGGSDTVRFGHLRPGENAYLNLVLENRTDRPVVVAGIDRTCGCTAFEFDSEPLMPDEARSLIVRFDARGVYGWQLKTADLRFAGARGALRLWIEARVE